jgi:DNA-nicking Smr family endonuclease
MNFFAKCFKFLLGADNKNKDSGHQQSLETKSSAEEIFFDPPQENSSDKSFSDVKSVAEGKQTDLKYNKTVYKKKRKKKKQKPPPSENKKIKNIQPDQDLYELFTGKKNSEVSEYIPKKDDGSKQLNLHEKFMLYPPPEKTVDLHNLRSFEAEIKIENTVVSSKIKGIKTVCFITGKGTHSKNNDSVLKKLAERMAVEYKKKGEIFTFRWEKKKKKKSGAIIFYL